MINGTESHHEIKESQIEYITSIPLPPEVIQNATNAVSILLLALILDCKGSKYLNSVSTHLYICHLE